MRSQWISLIASEDRLREFKNREFKKIKHNRKKSRKYRSKDKGHRVYVIRNSVMFNSIKEEEKDGERIRSNI